MGLIVEDLALSIPFRQNMNMDKHQKLLQHIMLKKGDVNVPFIGLCQLLTRLGFDERIKGDHHIFTMIGIDEIINL